jgi:hypothetical protein
MSIEQVWIAVITLAVSAAAAVAAWRAAAAASASAKEAHRTVQAQLVSSLLDAYASVDMLKAIEVATSWSGEPIRLGSEIDCARRHIAHHFHKIAKLKRLGLLDDDVVRTVATKGQVALFCKVVEPMEAKVSAGYDKASFDILAELHGGRQYLPAVPKRADES